MWILLEKHYATFEQEFEQKYQKAYGYRRAVVDDVVRYDLSPERLLLAYRNGLFPWYGENQPIL